MADKVFKIGKAIYQGALVGVTSYEVGKSHAITDIGNRQIVTATPKAENSHKDSEDSSNIIYILIGVIVFAVFVFAIKELRKCINCFRPIERPVELRNNQPNNNNNNIRVDV